MKETGWVLRIRTGIKLIPGRKVVCRWDYGRSCYDVYYDGCWCGRTDCGRKEERRMDFMIGKVIRVQGCMAEIGCESIRDRIRMVQSAISLAVCGQKMAA